MSYLWKNLILGFIVLFLIGSQTHAQSVPTFPSCLNPQGTLKVQHLSGTHGIPGNATSYTGIDSVYKLTDTTLIQCLCPPDGKGIQTNWWKVSDLSQEEIDKLVSEGWIYIANGSAWGLDSAPYLAKNLSYSCVGGSGGSSGENTSVAGKAGEILGLASTGNIASIFFYSTIGILFISTGFFMRSLYKRELA